MNDTDAPTVHLQPFLGPGPLPCCGRSDVPRGDRLTARPEYVTCPTVDKDPRKAFNVRDCYHLNAVEVRSITDEVVALLCPECDRQLPSPGAETESFERRTAGE